MPFDLVVEDAVVVVGTRAAGGRADVGVTGGTVTAVGIIPATAAAARRVPASGRVLAPGFIDMHTHSDVTVLKPNAGINMICQGVTTQVTGNCGFSPFPVSESRISLLNDHLAYLGPDRAEISWLDFGGYAGSRCLGSANPKCCMPGRAWGVARPVAGLSRGHLRDADVRDMCRHLEEALDQGAFGFTSGLTYVPSMFASTDELTVLGQVAARYGAIYATHARATAGRELTAIEEAVSVGRDSGVRVEYSHIALNDPRKWGCAAESLRLFEEARGEGLDIGFDLYPYDASASSIAQYLPDWLLTGREQVSRAQLSDPVTRARALKELSKGFYDGIPWIWDRVMLTQAGPADAGLVGLRLDDIAERLDCQADEAFLRLYERSGNATQVALFYRTETDMVEFLRHPASVIGSDGVAMARDSLDARPHPRFYGTFPRVLGRYARDQGVVTLEEAVRKMTGEPADRLGLEHRGYVRVGCAADLVVFSPRDVSDTATFLCPNTSPIGIESVIVNGRVVVEDGHWNGGRFGQVLRHNASK